MPDQELDKEIIPEVISEIPEVVGMPKGSDVSATATTEVLPVVDALNSDAGRRNLDRDRRVRNTRRPRAVRERVKPEFDQKIIDIRRVARVVSGGRRFSFSVAMSIGNRKGMVGVGLGKGTDTALAIDKAMRHARKHMVKVPLTKTNSIPYDVTVKFASARIMIMPSPGRGLVVGGPIRSVLELAGVTDVVGKVL